MPLSKLILEPDAVGFLLVVDCLRHRADDILIARINSLLRNNFIVHVYLYEWRKREFMHRIVENKRLNIVECSADLYGWNKDGGSLITEGLPSLPSTSSENERTAVVIDSVTPLLQHYSIQQICIWLKNATKNGSEKSHFRQVMAVLHGDLHEMSVENSLCYIADTTIHLIDTPISSHGDNTSQQLQCKIVRKILGKNPKITNETYTIDADLNVRSEEVSEKPKQQIQDGGGTKQKSNPAENLTFNLTVREDESEARSRVKLPYIHTSEQENKNKIAELDELDVDDIEEDPDDDLDI